LLWSVVFDLELWSIVVASEGKVKNQTQKWRHTGNHGNMSWVMGTLLMALLWLFLRGVAAESAQKGGPGGWGAGIHRGWVNKDRGWTIVILSLWCLYGLYGLWW
jgi:hypothetical protein